MTLTAFFFFEVGDRMPILAERLSRETVWIRATSSVFRHSLSAKTEIDQIFESRK
jgi:hypothetical protein